MRFSFALVPAEGDVFTEEAAISLLGQTPSVNGITIGKVDYNTEYSKGKVIAAILQTDGSIWITVEIR